MAVGEVYLSWMKPRTPPPPPPPQIIVGPWVWSKVRSSNHRVFHPCRRLRASEIPQRVSAQGPGDVVDHGGRRRPSAADQLAASLAQIETQVCHCACVAYAAQHVPLPPWCPHVDRFRPCVTVCGPPRSPLPFEKPLFAPHCSLLPSTGLRCSGPASW
jgi:hypothetical protein